MTAGRSRSQWICPAVAIGLVAAAAGIRRAIVPPALRLHRDDRLRQRRHGRAAGAAGASRTIVIRPGAATTASSTRSSRSSRCCAIPAIDARSICRRIAPAASSSAGPRGRSDSAGRAWILQAYALQNVLFWLVLAAVMTRWLRPDTPRGARARGRRASSRTACCTRCGSALLDGPSMLLIALAIAASERGRLFTSAAIVGVAGLGRETNLLAVARLAMARRTAARG